MFISLYLALELSFKVIVPRVGHFLGGVWSQVPLRRARVHLAPSLGLDYAPLCLAVGKNINILLY